MPRTFEKYEDEAGELRAVFKWADDDIIRVSPAFAAKSPAGQRPRSDRKKANTNAATRPPPLVMKRASHESITTDAAEFATDGGGGRASSVGQRTLKRSQSAKEERLAAKEGGLAGQRKTEKTEKTAKPSKLSSTV